MSVDADPVELPDFVAEGFLEGYESEYIDTTELIAEDPTWRGPAAPAERTVTIALAVDVDGAVVIENNPEKPAEEQLLFSNEDAAIEQYRDLVEETAEAETSMVSAAGRVTVQRSPAPYTDDELEFTFPDGVIDRVKVTGEQTLCNRCHEPVPADDQRSIGDIVFCTECHNEVCGRCGTEIPGVDNQYVTDGVGAGTTCPSCTAEHVEWLCSNCESEIQDEEEQVLIEEGRVEKTYCQDCAPDIREQLEDTTESQEANTNQDPPF